MTKSALEQSSIKVSVVVPIFNKQDYLSDCLDSILGQSFSDIEIICVDDASTDASPDILASYAKKDNRVRVYRSIINLGAGRSRNIGLRHARGIYVQFSDADDLLPVNGIRALYQLAEHSQCVAVRGTLEVLGPSKEWLQRRCSNLIMPDQKRFAFSDNQLLWLPWFHTCYLFSRSFLTQNMIQYPDFSDGEDPVFLASALVAAPLLSTTSSVCYIYRTDRPLFRSMTFLRLIDHLRHVRVVKSIYMDKCSMAWDRVCSPFYLSLAHEFLDNLELVPSELMACKELSLQIWPADDIALTYKLPETTTEHDPGVIDLSKISNPTKAQLWQKLHQMERELLELDASWRQQAEKAQNHHLELDARWRQLSEEWAREKAEYEGLLRMNATRTEA